jgi:hypothetical protein
MRMANRLAGRSVERAYELPGAPIAHVGLHVGAVVHSYDTDLFLPPH